MTEQQQWPGVVPYVEFYTGTKRILLLHLTSGNVMIADNPGKLPPIASIDGRQYVVYWGTVSFEIPAERACHVSVHVEGDYLQQAATILLAPGAEQVQLTYTTHYTAGVGSLTLS